MSNPRIIERPFLELENEKVPNEAESPAEPEPAATPPSQLEVEKAEIEELKRESQNILAETERIVMELLEKARDEAKAIISSAQDEADVLRAQVFEEARALRENARNEGYQQGLKQAQMEIEAVRQLALEQSRAIVEEARQNKLETLRSTETDMIRLIIAIAKKVIATELTLNPQVITNVVREAISYLDNPENIKVYVNPDELQILLDTIKMEGLYEIGRPEMEVELKADRRVSPGGCIVDSDSGYVDAQLATRMEKVEQAVMDVVHE